LAPASCPLLTASALFFFGILLLYNAATAAAATEFEEDKIIVKPKMQEEEGEEATTNVNRERDSTLVICCQWSQAWSCCKGEEGAVAPFAFWVAKVGCSYGVRRYVMGSVYLGL